MWWEIPGHLEARNGRLTIAGLDVDGLARAYGTPIHMYNLDRAVAKYRDFRDAMKRHLDPLEVRVHYAMKTNSNPALLEALRNEDSWLDVVSMGEAKFALKRGYQPDKILYTGTSVSDNELRTGLALGIRLNMDSPSELRRLKLLLDSGYAGLAQGYGVSVRLDPGERGAGHVPENITTGVVTIHGEEVPAKFGVDKSEILYFTRRAESLGIDIRGVHFHIGSNWRTEAEIEAFFANLDRALEYADQMSGIVSHKFEFLDVGGGPGVRYKEEHQEFSLDYYGQGIADRVKKYQGLFSAVGFEPGRYISADAGILVTTINDIKEKGAGDGFLAIVGVDTGFSHLGRPEVYNSHHEAVACTAADGMSATRMSIVGRVCETGDFLTRDPIVRSVPSKEGDRIAFLNAGSYVKTMEMSRYNMLGSPPELMIRNGIPDELYEYPVPEPIARKL